MPGSFTIRPIEAKLTHSTDLITKMSPYVSVNLGSQKFDGPVSNKGNKNPVWNDVLTLPNSGESSFVLNLMDKDRLTKDDLIGSAMFNMRDIQTQGSGPHWYPLFYKNKPAGEILLDIGLQGGSTFGQQGFQQTGFQQSGLQSGFQQAGFQQSGLTQQGIQSTYASERNMQSGFVQQDMGLHQTGLNQGTIINQTANVYEHHEPSRFFTEQHQSVQPHTFLKNVEVTETVPVQKQIEVMEARKVMKDVEYTQAVPVQKQIDTVEPVVVPKYVEVIEPRLVNKTIEVIENVPVKRMVEVVEMVHKTQVVETMEPQTFHKQVEVTEHVPVMRQVQVSQPMTVQKQVEFVEPVITTHTITKEIRPEVIVDERVTTSVGPASLIRESGYTTTHQQAYTTQQQVYTTQQQNLTNQFSQMQLYSQMSEQERLMRDQQLMQKEGWTQGLDSWRRQRVCSAHRQFECDQANCYNGQTYRWI